jgi:hypothetical protein
LTPHAVRQGRVWFAPVRTAWLTLIGAAGIALLAAAPSRADDAPRRIEARSETLLAVAIVDGDRMSIHVSRLADNAPVRDAALAVMLRGVLHPAISEPDGSYRLQTKDLQLPGAAAVEFQVTVGQGRESLKADLLPAAVDAKPEGSSNARQLGWWVLNFTACLGFLMLWSRRRKAKAEAEARAERAADSQD